MQNLKSRTSVAVPCINVTPLIDVLLVLLIIFMIISPVRPSKFEAKIPERPEQEDPVINNDALVVTLDLSGGYSLNQQPAETLQDLEALLHYALDGRPADRRAVFIKAPRLSNYGAVVKVIDVMKAAGSAPIGLQIEDLDR